MLSKVKEYSVNYIFDFNVKTLLILVYFIQINEKAISQIVLSTLNNNILYASTENRIDFTLKNYPMDNIELKASYGELKKNEFGIYIWFSCEKKSFVEFYAFDNKKNKNIDSMMALVKYLPNPTISLKASLVNYGHFGRPFLHQTGGIYAFLNSDYNIECNVNEFKIIIRRPGLNDEIIVNKTGTYSQEVLKVLESLIASSGNLSDNDSILITYEDIIVNCGCEQSDRKITDKLIFIIKRKGPIKMQYEYCHKN